jgi:hypothetical protein
MFLAVDYLIHYVEKTVEASNIEKSKGEAVHLDPNDIEQALHSLRRLCVDNHMQTSEDEWWSYSWCFNHVVEQHHIDPRTHQITESHTIGYYDAALSTPDLQVFREATATCESGHSPDGLTVLMQQRHIEVKISCCNSDDHDANSRGKSSVSYYRYMRTQVR